MKTKILLLTMLSALSAFSQPIDSAKMTSLFTFPDIVDSILLLKQYTNIDSEEIVLRTDTIQSFSANVKPIYQRIINGIEEIYPYGLQLKAKCGEVGYIDIVEMINGENTFKIFLERVPCPIVDNKAQKTIIGRTYIDFFNSSFNLKINNETKKYIDSIFTIDKK